MGYLFYADVLGMQARLARDPDRARAALNALELQAISAAQAYLPGALPANPDSIRLVMFNDSVFFHADSLERTVHSAATLAYQLFVAPDDNGGPIGLRGTIIRTDEMPQLVRRDSPSFFVGTRLVVGNIGQALLAEKAKVLGCRMVFHSTLLAEAGFSSWDARLQAKVFKLGDYLASVPDNVLKTDAQLKDYCDVCWMNVESNERFESLTSHVDRFVWNAATSQRAALHAAATLALHQATRSRRNGLVVMLRQLWHGVSKGLDNVYSPNPDSYEEWLALASEIKRLRNGSLQLPVDMANAKPPDTTHP